MYRTFLLALLALASMGFSGPSSAQAPAAKPAPDMDMKSMQPMEGDKQPKAAHPGTGIVKSVDASAGSITLAHEPIKSLNWPAMTMGFKVRDKHLLDKVKPGDKVQFTLVQSGKDYVVTSIK
jgi:Cu(I)/Ag(I) efflux system protein CusF